MTMTMAPPVVQPSLGLMALIHGVAAHRRANQELLRRGRARLKKTLFFCGNVSKASSNVGQKVTRPERNAVIYGMQTLSLSESRKRRVKSKNTSEVLLVKHLKSKGKSSETDLHLSCM